MKILFQYLTGGGGGLSNIKLLLQALSRHNPDDAIFVVCAPTSELQQLQLLPNVKILTWGKGKYKEIDRLKLGFGGLKKIAYEIKADVVWSLNIGSYVPMNIPHILSMNNPHQVYPWSVTRYHPGSRFRVAALRWFFRKSLRFSDCVVVQTPIMKRYVEKIYDAPRKIHVIPKAVENSFDVETAPLSLALQGLIEPCKRNSWFTFLYVATCMPHKNHKILIDVFELLAAGGIKTRVLLTIKHEELVMLGGEKAQQLLYSGHIVTLGWVEKKYLKAVYDASDACLMPSLLESLSSAHLEAMQWGKPQIVADLSYARDLCGDAALYVAAESAVAWVDLIKNFIFDKSEQTRLIDNGFKKMLQFPKTWADVAQDIHDVLEQVIIAGPDKNNS